MASGKGWTSGSPPASGPVRSLCCAKPDPGRARSDFPPDTRFWDMLIDGRAEIGPSATVAESAFGGEFTELILQVAPHFDFVLPSGLWLALRNPDPLLDYFALLELI